METKEEISKKNKRLAIWLGIFAVTVGVLSYRFWQQLVTEIITLQ